MPVTVTITNDTPEPVTVTLSVRPGGTLPSSGVAIKGTDGMWHTAAESLTDEAKGDTGPRKGKLLVLQRSGPGEAGWTDMPGAYGIVGPDDDVRVDVREGPYC